MMRKILHGPGCIKIVLDRSQVFVNDPGAGTPAMVSRKIGRHEYTASYDCAHQTGELLGLQGGIGLTTAQAEWLDAVEDELTEFLWPTDESKGEYYRDAATQTGMYDHDDVL